MLLLRPQRLLSRAAQAASAAVTYLLQASFTGANQTVGNTETLGPTGSGATYEGYTDAGILTTGDTSTGSNSITSNTLTMVAPTAGVTVANWAVSEEFTPSAGTPLKWSHSQSQQSPVGFRIATSAGFNVDFSGDLLAFGHNGGSLTSFNQNHSPAGTIAENISPTVLNYATSTTYEDAVVLGGFTAGVPSASGTNGVLFFRKVGANWTLASVGTQADFNQACKAWVYQFPDSGGDNLTIYDMDIHPTGLTSCFTPTGYALDTSIALSDTFTHVADHWFMTKITTLPSSGSIDIGIRDDLAIRVSSAGAVTLVKAYATTPVTLITSAGTASNGSTIQLRQSGSSHELWVDGANKGTATDAANQTGTGGDIHSLGTGGAVSYVYSLPLVSATFDTALESF